MSIAGLIAVRAGYRETRKTAQEKYRETENGKKKHSEDENRRRHREKNEDWVFKAAAKTCECIKKIIRSIFENDKNLKDRTPKCNYCGTPGKSVDKFPKRSYGKFKPVLNAALSRKA